MPCMLCVIDYQNYKIYLFTIIRCLWHHEFNLWTKHSTLYLIQELPADSNSETQGKYGDEEDYFYSTTLDNDQYDYVPEEEE